MLINELFKGLQRDCPFAFMSKDPPTALLWLTFGGSYLQRNMQFRYFYKNNKVYLKPKSRKSLYITKADESLFISCKPCKSIYIRKSLASFCVPCKAESLSISPKRLAISLLSMSRPSSPLFRARANTLPDTTEPRVSRFPCVPLVSQYIKPTFGVFALPASR